MFNKKNTEQPKNDEVEKQYAADRIARETMTGDLRDVILDFLKHDKNPLTWNLRSESDQIEVIERINKAVGYAVERAVNLMAADGRPTIAARLDKVIIKDEIQGTIIISKAHPNRNQIFDSQGQVVLIVVANDDQYVGERAPVAINPMQASLPMEEEGEDGDGMADPQP